jgi:hypothetical protein
MPYTELDTVTLLYTTKVVDVFFCHTLTGCVFLTLLSPPPFSFLSTTVFVSPHFSNPNQYLPRLQLVELSTT